MNVVSSGHLQSRDLVLGLSLGHVDAATQSIPAGKLANWVPRETSKTRIRSNVAFNFRYFRGPHDSANIASLR